MRLAKATPSHILISVTTKLTKGCGRVGDQDFRTSFTNTICMHTFCDKPPQGLNLVPGIIYAESCTNQVSLFRKFIFSVYFILILYWLYREPELRVYSNMRCSLSTCTCVTPTNISMRNGNVTF